MKKPGYTKRIFPGPYPEPHTIDGEKMPPDGKAQPQHDNKHPPMMISHPIGVSYPAGHDFGPYVDHKGEGLYHSFHLDFYNSIPYNSGGIHPHTGLLLFALALNMRPDVIVETGTFFGTSTLYLAKACEIWGQGMVYTIDPEIKWVHPDVLDHPRVEFIRGLSEVEIPKLIDRVGHVDFAFLDSWKRLSLAEFALLDEHVVEGGIVACHDTQFLNSGRTFYDIASQIFSDYDRILFSGVPHVDNPHRFHGNADDRGLFVFRKRNEDPFIDAADSQSGQYGDKQVCILPQTVEAVKRMASCVA